MGQIPGEIHLVSTVADVAALRPSATARLAYVTQTTLSLDDTRDIIAALTARFPDIRGPDVKDICYATQNRQAAVRLLAAECDVILVVGADYSSNSNRLREIGEEAGSDSYLIQDAEGLDPAWLEGAGTVGITAGASAPEALGPGSDRPARRPVRGDRDGTRRRRGERLLQAAARAGRRGKTGGVRRLARPRRRHGKEPGPAWP